MNQQNQGDPNFSLKINVSGITAAGGGIDIDPGYYETGPIQSVTASPGKGGGLRVRFEFEVITPKGKAKRSAFLNAPKDDTDKARYYWRAALESVGYTPAELDGGDLTVGAAAFVGRSGKVMLRKNHYQGKVNDDCTFMAPADWAAKKEAGVPPEPRGGQVNRVAAPGALGAAPSALGAAPSALGGAPGALGAAPSAASPQPTAAVGGVLGTLGLG